jgi:hypothetical protein
MWYRPLVDRTAEDQPVIAALTTLVDEHSRWGFWLCYDRLRVLGHPWTWKRVYRVYCALRLNLKRRGKKRLPTRPRVPLEAPAILNHRRDGPHTFVLSWCVGIAVLGLQGNMTGKPAVNEVGAFGPVPCDHADRLERSLR